MTYKKKDKSKQRKIKVGRKTTLFLIQPWKEDEQD
jgi:hypothetical protein